MEQIPNILSSKLKITKNNTNNTENWPNIASKLSYTLMMYRKNKG